jgi:CBS domain-containing protein
MTRSILSVDPTTTVAEAATIMGERAAGSALVMEGDRLLGIFTERDIVKALGQHFDAAGHAVADWMTADPLTVPAETSVEEALRTMLDRGFRHLPVVEERGVVGVVSMRDLSAAGAGES